MDHNGLDAQVQGIRPFQEPVADSNRGGRIADTFSLHRETLVVSHHRIN
jgi:hypothetical protein